MNTSEQINDIAAALNKAQASMKPAVKDSVNPHFRTRYADLAAVWDACREPLTSNGIAVVQDVLTSRDFVGNTPHVGVTTRLIHTSGQWMEFGPVIVPLTKADAQGVGSATSYGRRYALSAAVGIVSDDDDGEGAVRAPHQEESTSRRPAAAEKSIVEKPSTHASGGARVITVREAATGTNAKGQWTLYAIKLSDGREGKTFSKSIFKAALEAKERHVPVDMDLNEKGDIINFVPVYQHQAEPEPAPF